MDVDGRFDRKSFEDMDYGALFAGVIGDRVSVNAIKAYKPTNDGSREDFFVTIGSFEEKYGQYPIQYHVNALYDGPVLELIGGYQILPSLSPGDLASELSSGDGVSGELLILKQNQILIGAAFIDNFDRAHQRWLDVKTGELLPPPRHTDYIVTRRWRLTASVQNAAPETIFEFSAETETA